MIFSWVFATKSRSFLHFSWEKSVPSVFSVQVSAVAGERAGGALQPRGQLGRWPLDPWGPAAAWWLHGSLEPLELRERPGFAVFWSIFSQEKMDIVGISTNMLIHIFIYNAYIYGFGYVYIYNVGSC